MSWKWQEYKRGLEYEDSTLTMSEKEGQPKRRVQERGVSWVGEHTKNLLLVNRIAEIVSVKFVLLLVLDIGIR